jgi:two-component system response regulator DesR
MIRVLIAEDQHLIRGALIALVDLEPDMLIVAEVDRGDAIEDAVLHHRPDVAVLDIDLPGMSGLDAAARVRASAPDCEILVLTGLSQPSHLLRALEEGVRGFLPKDAPVDELAQGIRRVASGLRVLDPALVAVALEIGASPLTNRETDVLRVAATGASVERVAADLYLSSGTVRNYLSNAIAKLGARNRIDAIRIATEAGWL